jgi:hypothetical protein
LAGCQIKPDAGWAMNLYWANILVDW